MRCQYINAALASALNFNRGCGPSVNDGNAGMFGCNRSEQEWWMINNQEIIDASVLPLPELLVAILCFLCMFQRVVIDAFNKWFALTGYFCLHNFSWNLPYKNHSMSGGCILLGGGMPFTQCTRRWTEDVTELRWTPRLGILGSQQGQARPLLTKSYAGIDLSVF